MKFLKRIFNKIRGQNNKLHLVTDPKELASQATERRIIIFGSRCVVLHPYNHEPYSKSQ